MNIKEKIKFDYVNAKDNGQILLSLALEDLQPLINGRLNQNELLNSIEGLIEKIGYSIISKARKRKNVETDVFKMVLLNNYICEFRFKNKSRRILLEYHKNEDLNDNWNSKIEVPPKVITVNRGLFNFFK